MGMGYKGVDCTYAYISSMIALGRLHKPLACDSKLQWDMVFFFFFFKSCL